MTKKRRQMDLSSISPMECIIGHLYWIIIMFINYKNLIFIPLDKYEYSIGKSKTILIICMIIASILGTAIRWKKCMSVKGVLADIMIGIGFYTILAYKRYYYRWMKTLFIAFFAFILVYFSYIFTKKSRGHSLKEIRNKNRKRFIIKYRIFKFLNVTSLVLGLTMTVLIVPISYNRIFHGAIIIPDKKYNTSKGDDTNHNSDESILTYDMYQILKIRYISSWDPLTTSEKLNVLQNICNRESNHWGIDFKITIVMDDLKDYTLGSYNDAERKITIDKQHLENDEPEEILNTVLHEMYHAWEYSLVRLYLCSSDSQRKMIVFQHCEEYLKEMKNYQSAGDDYESFMEYYCQYMESDSRSYAENAVERYYNEMDEMIAGKIVTDE